MKTKSFTISTLNLILLLSLILGQSCKKEKPEDIKIPNPIQFDNAETTTATFIGQIINENGSPMPNVTIQTGKNKTNSDNDGLFYFSNISTPKKATLIKANSQGYFKGFRTISVLSNQDNVLKIMLIRKPPVKTFNSSTGGKIEIINGGSIDFPENALNIVSSGKPYNGEVSVFAKWINPEDENLFDLLPGALRGINTAGEEKSLITYGMHAVELYGSSGEKLQIAQGKLATMRFPIPESIISEAPPSIPLWSLNEDVGLWKEEGHANKTGTEYVGKVSHFSFWNCDYPGSIISFKVRFTYGNLPLANANVILKLKANILRNQGYANTNSLGISSGKIPSNQSFNLYIREFQSTKLTLIRSFSSSTSALDLGTIELKGLIAGPPKPTTIIGVVVDCSNKPVPNAIVKTTFPTTSYFSCNSSGSFSYTYLQAGTQKQIVLNTLNPKTLKIGSKSFNVISNKSNSLGNLKACDSIVEHISWKTTIGGVTTSNTIFQTPIHLSFDTLNTQVFGRYNKGYLAFDFSGPDLKTGQHKLKNWYDSTDSTQIIQSPISVTITQYGAPGSFVEGRFKGVVKGVRYTQTIDCNFKVKRIR